MFKSDDIIQYTGKSNDKISEYELFLVIGFVDDSMVLSSLGNHATLNHIQMLSDNLISTIDIKTKGNYQDSFVKLTSIREMKVNNIWDVRK